VVPLDEELLHVVRTLWTVAAAMPAVGAPEKAARQLEHAAQLLEGRARISAKRERRRVSS
jgi:hypothetical protein